MVPGATPVTRPEPDTVTIDACDASPTPPTGPCTAIRANSTAREVFDVHAPNVTIRGFAVTNAKVAVHLDSGVTFTGLTVRNL